MWPAFVHAAQVAPITQLLQAVLAVVASLVRTPWPQQAVATNGTKYDFIVLGAGTAGAIVATRLAEAGQSVLLLEAGGNPPAESEIPSLLSLLSGSQYDWNYQGETAPDVCRAQKAKKIQLTRGKMLGGSSGANYMLWVLGQPADYDAWAADADDSWTDQNLSHYIQNIESVEDPEILTSPYSSRRGRDGKIIITKPSHSNQTSKYLQSFSEMGYKISQDYTTGPEPSFSEAQYTIGKGIRQSTAAAYLSPARDLPTLHVLKHTLVTKVLFDENKNAFAVEALSDHGKVLTFETRKEIILSAGAINTPQILMLSGIGPREHLEQHHITVLADLPVGDDLQDHIFIPLLLTGDNVTEPDPTSTNEFPAPTLLGFSSLNKTHPFWEYEVTACTMVRGSKLPVQLCTVIGLREELCDRWDEAAAKRETLLAMVQLLHPESRGRVRLNSTDATQPPSIYLGYYDDRRDLERLTAYVKDFLRVLNTTFFKNVGGGVVDIKLAECAAEVFGSHGYWECYTRETGSTVYHPAGSAALGRALDARLRVRGVRRLRVADASAAPRLPSGNINAAVAILAEHAAHIIKEDHRLA